MKINSLLLLLVVLPVLGPPSASAQTVLRSDGSVDWTRYHNSAESARFLRELVARYPGLARMYSIGKSYAGKDLWMLELTNRKIKAAADKPGYYIDGGVHACELAGSEQVLYLAWYFATRHGKDPEVTELLDTRSVYLRPKFNPDGADHCLTHPDGLRSTVRPWDDDHDGSLDEDPAEDLDGDGAITSIRVPSAKGNQKVSPDDPRLMIERNEGETGGTYYMVRSEGTDNDGDGEFNEDGVGGIDMNRNFPRTWGLPYQQSGAGPFPLSEPETRATLDFIVSHPNITGIAHNHTSGGFMYQLPSTNPPADHEPDDLALVKIFGNRYTEITGHRVQDSYTGEGRSRHGTLISWAYFDFGVIGWVPEHWGGFGKDYDNDKRVSQKDRLRWNDEELGGTGFTSWKPFKHPQLGQVEIGGWKRKFTSQNPPGKFLEREIAMKVPWFIYIVKSSPLLRLVEASVAPEGNGAHRIEVQVVNEGFLPTNVTDRALKAHLVQPVRAKLILKGADIVTGTPTADLGHIPGTRPGPGRASGASGASGATGARGASGTASSGAAASNRRSVSWVVKAAPRGGTAEVVIVSEKGGTERRTLILR
jgi:hypothetical protein